MVRIAGNVKYELTYKKVKNINLRVNRAGAVLVSADRRVSADMIDGYVLSKTEWIERARRKMQDAGSFNFDYTDEQCAKVLLPMCELAYGKLRGHIKSKPEIRFRSMKSCWGVCHPQKNYITFNRALLSKPETAAEYVVLHEYVHLAEPNHQAGFHALMKKFMPDYSERRKLLK